MFDHVRLVTIRFLVVVFVVGVGPLEKPGLLEALLQGDSGVCHIIGRVLHMVVALDPSWTPVIAGICHELLERGAPVALEVYFDCAVEIL